MLEYCGPRLSTGEIERSLIYSGIPALDQLDEEDLTPEQVAKAIDSGLYRYPNPKGKKPAEGEKE